MITEECCPNNKFAQKHLIKPVFMLLMSKNLSLNILVF